jgi:spore coat polysaccharide biosynthesis protein SpsF (cytidylyltransferase family)/RimJ/RimL family protein N-acetyltransferase
MRCGKSDADFLVLATSGEEGDDILAVMASEMGWNVVRGGVDDVLGRYAKAVRQYGLEAVVRITGDCILTDYRMINFALSAFTGTKTDHLVITNVLDGLNVEVMSGKAICEADEKAGLPSEREHVHPYITNSKRYKKSYVPYPYGNESDTRIHLSLDYREDAEVLEGILAELKGEDFSYEDVVVLIREKPALIEKTRHIVPSVDGIRRMEEKDREFIRGIKGAPLEMEGERICLKMLLPGDVTDDYVDWMNDEDITQFLESRDRTYTADDLIEYVKSMSESPDDFLFGIFLRENGRQIGNIKIGGLNRRHNFADTGLIIGDKREWGKGFGTEAIALASKYAFETLKLNKLIAGMYANNIGCYKAFICAGYREAGRLTKHSLYKGQYVDSILVERLAERV